MLHRDVASVVTHWVEELRLDPDNYYIHRGSARVFRITKVIEGTQREHVRLRRAMTEGVGLVMRKRTGPNTSPPSAR